MGTNGWLNEGQPACFTPVFFVNCSNNQNLELLASLAFIMAIWP